MKILSFCKVEYQLESKPLEEFSKEELLDVVRDMDAQIRLLRREKEAIERVMNKFLAKDHPNELGALFKENNEIQKW